MSAERESLRTETPQLRQHVDILTLLERIGFKSLRMKLFATGLLYTAATIALLCLVVYRNLIGAAGANGLLHQTSGQVDTAIVVSGLVIFAFLGLVAFLVSDNLSRSVARRQSFDRDQIEDQWAQAQEKLAQSRKDSAQLEEKSAQLQSCLEQSGERLAQAEQQLAQMAALLEESRQSNALLLSTINSLPQGVFCKDLAGAYTFANKAFGARMNLSPDRIIGKTVFDFLPADVASKHMTDDQKVIETAQSLETVLDDEDPSGKPRRLQMIRTPRCDENGSVVGTAGIFWDVTESKQAEEALARERDLLSALMDSSLDFIYFKDLQSRFIRINKAHAAVFGLSDPADAAGKADSDFFTGEHAQEAYDDEQRIIRTGQALVGVEERETWPDKEDTWVSTTKNPLYDKAGRIIGTFGITRDITERKRAAQALDRSLSEFLAFVSNVSEGNLTLRGEEGQDTLGRVAQSVNKMLDSFSGMLTEVKQLGLSVSSSATQILVAADEITVGTQQQTDETSNVTTSVEEMAASMAQVAQNAEASAEAARRALDKADNGSRSVRHTSEAMVRINSAVEQTADKMRTLARRSSEITEIMGLINGIAAQTNLLALNAAIEAAHAGDAGLGFSVVAEEIRKLADKSVQATRDVGSLIKGIHSETGDAISAMENGMKEVKNGLVLAEESRQALQDIALVLKESTELAEEISAASEQQTRVTVNLASAMQTISGITMEASAGAHQTSQIIHGMVGLSDKLNQSISQFKVRENLLGEPK